MFSEKLRGLVAHLLLSKKIISKKVLMQSQNYYQVFLKSHLKKLNTKTRSPSKWVEDNILHYDGFTEKITSIDKL